MKQIFSTIIASILFFCSCKQQVTSVKDYSPFLNTSKFDKKLSANTDEIEFWQHKLLTDSGSYIYKFELALHLIERFHLKANPDDLSKADSLLFNCLSKIGGKEPALYYTLIQNAILQHRFNEAGKYLQRLLDLGGDPLIVKLLSFDVYFEQGKYYEASNAISELGNKNQNFDFLIRNAKLLDHQGKSEASLRQMELAYQIALKKGKPSAINWCLTNLADMYTHAGKIEKAYNYYLSALQKDSSNFHALNGIAKICYLKDKDYENAENIILFSQQIAPRPENYLLLSEIEGGAGNIEIKSQYENLFFKMLYQNKYGNMYNKYILSKIFSGKGNKSEALSISLKEIQNRATPETYSWLAYSYFQNGKIDEATKLVQAEVVGKTFEPESLFIAGIILNKSHKIQSEDCLKQCLKSEFELGPEKYKILQRLLKS